MTSGNSGTRAPFSQSVTPSDDDLGLEFVNNLVCSANPQVTPEDAQKMRESLYDSFGDESLMFAFHTMRQRQQSLTQQGPTLQEYYHFIHHYEAQMTNDNIKLTTQNEQLTAENEQLRRRIQILEGR